LKSFWMALVGSAITCWLLQTAIAFALVSLLTNPPLDRFRSSSFEFSLAKGWSCATEETEFVCSQKGSREKTTIIVIAQKYRGPDDNDAAYTAHLRQPRTYDTGRKQMTSEVRYIKHSQIGRFTWVDSLHYQSEVPNYLTRYLATTTSHLGILVTFSVYKDDYHSTVREFESMIASLKVHQHLS
jgi:hypothetical protein